MEEIALAVVPPENYSLTWEESTEEEEGDTSSSEEEGLVVVEEEADDDTAEPGSERDDSIWSRKEWIESILPKAVQRCIAREIKLDTEILERNRFDAHWKNQVFEWTAEHCGGRVHMMEVLLRELCEEVRKETKPEINLHPPGEDVGPDISEEIEKQLVGVKSQLGYTR